MKFCNLQLHFRKCKCKITLSETSTFSDLSNRVTGCNQVCAIKAPGFGENRKADLQDLAAVTGGSGIHTSHLMNLLNQVLLMFPVLQMIWVLHRNHSNQYSRRA